MATDMPFRSLADGKSRFAMVVVDCKGRHGRRAASAFTFGGKRRQILHPATHTSVMLKVCLPSSRTVMLSSIPMANPMLGCRSCCVRLE